jgi:hypothetical protein
MQDLFDSVDVLGLSGNVLSLLVLFIAVSLLFVANKYINKSIGTDFSHNDKSGRKYHDKNPFGI